MENFGLSPDKVEKLYHQALRLNHLTSQVHLMPTEKKSNGESSKVKARPSSGKMNTSSLNNYNNNGKSTLNSAGTMRTTDQYTTSMLDSLREWEVFKYGDDYGFKDLPTDPATIGSPKGSNGQYSSENNTDNNNRLSDIPNYVDQLTCDEDAFSGDFINVLNNVESVGEKFVKEIQAMKKLFSSNNTFKNQFEKVFCTLRREKIRLEIDLLQARRCIESLKNQLVIVQEEADQCRREADEERHSSNMRFQKLLRKFNETKFALEKVQKQSAAVRRTNLSKEKSKATSLITPIITIKTSINNNSNNNSSLHIISNKNNNSCNNNNNNNSQHDSSSEGKSYEENGEPMEETAGSPESCNEEAHDDLLASSRNGKSPASSSSVDLNSNLNGDCGDLSEELDLSTNHADHPMKSNAECNSDSFEVTIEEMGLVDLPNETNDPCICAAIVLSKGRIILHNLKRSEYLATIYEYRKYRPEFTEDVDCSLDPKEVDYDFVNMLPGSWFNSTIDGWFIGNEIPEEKNRPHPRLPDYILLEGLIPVEKALYIQHVVMKEDVKHATQVASVLIRRVLPDIYVKNSLLSGNTLKDEYPPAKCFIETLANGLPLGVGYRRFLAIQAHAFRVVGKSGPLSYIEIQSVRTTISKCLKERRRDDRRSGLKRKRSSTSLVPL